MKADQKVIGIGFLPFTLIEGHWRIFTIKELKSKPEINKESEMISFPIETIEKRDKSEEGALLRLIDEETGITLKQIRFYEVVPGRFSSVDRKGLEMIYAYGVFNGNYRQNFTPRDTDIVYAGWWTIEELLSFPKIRIEVSPILRHFIASGYLNKLASHS